MGNNCPCHGCLDRTITCHGVCKKYQEWKKVHEAEMFEQNEERKKGAAPTDRVKRRAWKKMKWK
jgi:hypothetical protein